MNDKKALSRRQFIGGASAAVAGALSAAQIPYVHGQAAGAEIKIGLIGCGGRGTGAALDAIGAATRVIYPASGYHTEDAAGDTAAKKDIKVVALADLFEDRLSRCRKQLDRVGHKIGDDLCFTGFDAYKKLLEVKEINYVIQATSPHFRPMHLMAAIQAGKNVFIEKPCAVDAPGIRMVMEAGALAKQKNLGIAAGTQRRHQFDYQETIKRIQDGAIGEIVYARCYWNGGEIWVIDRRPEMSDLEWQIRNWNYFTWLSGDHYVEQHVHNLDIMNWVLGAHPIKAVAAVGGRQVRTREVHGHIFDHFAVEYEYPNGVRMFSQARQINGCEGKVEEAVVGVNGTSNCVGGIWPKKGEAWSYKGKRTNAYQQEHENLIASIRAGKPINEAQSVAESTMTGILGREAAYSGRSVDWDKALASTKKLGPEKYDLAAPFPVPEVAKPGQYKLQ
jgi:predicted dehydrogenase